AVHPAAQAHALADQLFGDQAAVVGTHRHTVFRFQDSDRAALSATGVARGSALRSAGVGSGCAGGTATAGETGGATTPMEITYFRASSTLIFSSTTSARGTMRKKPEVGLGVVGT